MTIAETERWRKCATCGYLVPREASVCKRCVPDSRGATIAPPVPLPAAAPVGSAMPELLPADHGRRGVPSRRLPWLVGGGFVVALLIAFGVGIFGFRSGDRFPSQWDPKVRDIAGEVSRLRGLRFQHPVAVKFLGDAAFRRDIGVTGKATPAARRRLAQATKELRALGLITGDVDLLKSIDAERRSRVLAYYSPERQLIVVRATNALDVATRVTVAHEMTHVLQDQHFDLEALRRRVTAAHDSSSDAMRAIVEGDADRVEGRYIRDLSAIDRAAYQKSRDSQRETADSETVAVPGILSAQSAAPYRYGPAAIEVLLAEGGNRAIDAVMTRGVFNQKVFLDPTSVIHTSSATRVPAPKLRAGERALGESSSVGAYEGYLLLASRGDPEVALTAATGWSGASSRTFRHGRDTCVRMVIRGVNRRASDRLGTSFEAWATALPVGFATASLATGGLTTVSSCDPGASATLASPEAAIELAGGLLELNDALVGEFAHAGAPTETARCLARALRRDPQIRLVIAGPENDGTGQAAKDAFAAAAPAARVVCGLE